MLQTKAKKNKANKKLGLSGNVAEMKNNFWPNHLIIFLKKYQLNTFSIVDDDDVGAICDQESIVCPIKPEIESNKRTEGTFEFCCN